MRRVARATLSALLLIPVLACAPAPGDAPASTAPDRDHAAAARPAGPFLRALGTVQDGGLPHAGCSCVRCEAARHQPVSQRRRVASLALIDPRSDEKVLIDATPDIRDQLWALRDIGEQPQGRTDRDPLDGVLLTHAHMGHYTGLMHFGREALHTRELPVFCTPRMAAFLRGNGPWSQLVELGEIALREVAPGTPFHPLGDRGISVESLSLPHRDEYSDTVAFIVRGPSRGALYVPDTDTWDRWDPPLLEVLESIDVALLDATFYSADELPGRDPSEIPHPLVTASMDLLQSRVDAGTLEVWFTHLNHSNPLLEADSAARREVERRGFRVLREGDAIGL